MFSLFGKKDSEGRLPGPKDVPDAVGQQLVVTHKENPDWAWTLKSVMKPDGVGKNVFHVRVFSDSMAGAARVKIQDYTTLDAHPELVLYEGVYDKKSKKAKLELRYKKD
jgi:hypothetical protein